MNFTALLSLLPLASIALVIAAWIKIRPQLIELANKKEEGFVAALAARVALLEGEIIALRQAMDRERVAHEAEMRVVRHRLHNETTSLDGLLDLLEINPDRVIQSVAAIKERRARNKQAIAAEQGAMAGAQMGATG